MLNFDNKKFGQTASIIRKRWMKKILGDNKLSMRKRKKMYWKVKRLIKFEKVRNERRRLLLNGMVDLKGKIEADIINVTNTHCYGNNNDVVTSINKSGNHVVSNTDNIKSGSSVSIGFINSIGFIDSIGSIGSIGSTNSIGYIDSIGLIGSGFSDVSKVCKKAKNKLKKEQYLKEKKEKFFNKVLFMSLNVQTLADYTDYENIANTLKSDKLQYIVEMMHSNKVMCSALMEVRKLGTGSIPLDFQYTLYYCGGVKRQAGVGFILKNNLVKDLTIISVSDRIMFITGRIGDIDLHLAALYAPTHSTGDEIKGSFFDQVSSNIAKIPMKYRENSLCFIDSNSHIGPYNELWKNVRGKYVGDGQQVNSSGNLFLQFCAVNKLLIGNTFFAKDDYWTWSLPGSNKDCHRFTIDFCLVSKSLEKLLIDCGVDSNIDLDDIESDHRPLFLSMKLVDDNIKSKVQKKIVIKKNNIALDFNLLNNNFVKMNLINQLDGKMSNVKDIDSFNTILISAMNGSIPSKTRKPIASWGKYNKTLIELLVADRRYVRQLWLNSGKDVGPFRSLYRLVKANCRKKLRTIKRDFFMARSNRIQHLFNSGQSKQYFALVKDFVEKPPVCIPDQVFLKGNKELTCSQEERDTRIVEHFRDLLNQVSTIPDNILHFLPKTSIYKWNLQDPFTIEEFRKALFGMTKDKSCGPDGIAIETLQAIGPSETWRSLLYIFNKCLQTGIVPSTLKDVIVCPLFKKGDNRCMDNYRGISLISHHGKLLEKMVTNRLTDVAEKNDWLPESQNGFRIGRSTIHSIFLSRMLHSLCREKGIHCAKAYIDFVKAYDKVNQELLWIILDKRGVPEKMINLIRGFHEGSMASIKINGILSEPFELKCGLKQGSIIAPLLFNIFFGSAIEIIHNRVQHLGISLQFRNMSDIFNTNNINKEKIGNTVISIWNILFADDAEIVTDSPENLQIIMDCFSEVTSAYGQEISIAKSEVMFDSRSDRQFNIDIVDNSLNQVDEFRYLGSIESSDATCTLDIQARIKKANASFHMHKAAIFSNPNLSFLVSLSMYKVLVLTVLLYGCESWVITTKDLKTLEGFQYQILRAILKISSYDKISHTNILMLASHYGVEILPVEVVLRKKRLNFISQVECLGSKSLCYQVLHSDTTLGNRKKGNLNTFRSNFKRDLELFHIPVDTWQILAKDNKKWVNMIDTGVKLCFRKWLLDHRSIRYHAPEDLTERGKKLRSLASIKFNDVLVSLGYFLKSKNESNRNKDLQRRYKDVDTDDLLADLATIWECTIEM